MTPTAAQIAALPSILRRRVESDDIDHNGHMNVTRIFDAQFRSTRSLLSSCGLSETYAAERGMGTVAGEHSLRYRAELRLGDEFTTRVRVIARNDRAAHLMSFLVNETQQEVACILEVVLVHISHATRRPTPFPDDVADALEAHLVASRELHWEMPARIPWRAGSQASTHSPAP